MTIDEQRADAAANRALIRLLLEKHRVKDVCAMMQRTVSGREVTLRQVERIRTKMLAEGAARRRVTAKGPTAALYVDPDAPETFERQMARIAAGATIMPAPDFRAVGPSRTLGGVASGMV